MPYIGARLRARCPQFHLALRRNYASGRARAAGIPPATCSTRDPRGVDRLAFNALREDHVMTRSRRLLMFAFVVFAAGCAGQPDGATPHGHGTATPAAAGASTPPPALL